MQSPQLHVYKISNCINPLTIDKLIKDTRQGEPKFEEQNCIPLGELVAFWNFKIECWNYTIIIVTCKLLFNMILGNLKTWVP